MNDLTKCYFRSDDGDNYIIPASEIKEFDKLRDQIEDEEDNDTRWDLYDKVSSLYSKYLVEGDLYEIELYVNLKDVTNEQ